MPSIVSLLGRGHPGAIDYSNGIGGAATPTVTTSGNQENSILVSSSLVPGPTATTESLVVKYIDESALDLPHRRHVRPTRRKPATGG